MNDSAVRLIAHFDRWRARLRLAATARFAYVVVPLSIAAAQIVLLVPRPAWSTDGRLWGAVVAFALTICWAVAHVRTRSRREIARAIDRRLSFDDRAVSALHCLGHDDAFGRLVIDDAVSRLDQARRPGFKQLTLPAGLLRFAPILPLLPLLFVAGGGKSPGGSTSAANKPAVSGPADQQGRASGQRRGGGPESPLDAAQSAGRARSNTGQPPATERAATSDRIGGQPSGGSEPDEALPPGAIAATREAPRPLAQQGGSPVNRTGPSADVATREGGTGSDTARSETSGRGAGATGRRGAGAGGVQDGVIGGRTSGNAAMLAPRPASYPTEYHAAWARAQAAIAQDRIPPERRVHVRNYFIGIRP